MPKPAHVCVVRHGETDWNVSGVLQGWIDVPLNAKGRRQAQELGVAYAAAGFTAVWTSPLLRASETADIVAQVLKLPVPIRHLGLKERRFGAIQGIPKEELADLNPVLAQQLLRRNPAAEFPEGEDMEEFAERALGAILQIGQEQAHKCVMVVTHGWVMDAITREILGLPRHAVLNHKRKNGEAVWLATDGRTLQPAAQTPPP